MNKLWKELRGWIGSIALAFILTLIIGVFIVQPTKVSGHSMDPTLHDGQRVYISKLPHTFGYTPKYGDIVIVDSRTTRNRSLLDDIKDHPLFHLFEKNNEEHIIFIKRVIGKAGDELRFQDGHVYRNGEKLDEPYLNEAMQYSSKETVVVPDNYVFVMGDNRNHSQDSRAIGSIPLDHVLGSKIGAK
ncbi:MAG: signal peptidase I [Paenibacillaceae bacterium]|nr:signal peptidase I [Paenibacillaceae bacterium]